MDPITYRAQVLSDIFERPKNYAVFAVFEKINACLCRVFSSEDEEKNSPRAFLLLQETNCLSHVQFHIDPSSRAHQRVRRQFQGGVYLPRNSKTARLVSSSLHPILPDFIFGDKTV